MKLILPTIFGFLVIFSSCLNEKHEKRIYIKSIKIDSSSRIDWYVTSLIGGYSRSNIIQVRGNKEQIILRSHGITNISFDKNNRLLIVESTDELENYKEYDTIRVGDKIKVTFDLKGYYMNNAIGRLSRLKAKNINTKVPHHADSDF